MGARSADRLFVERSTSCSMASARWTFHDRAVAARDAQMVRLVQHVGAGEAGGSLELPAGELDQQAERVLEIDRVEDLPVAHAGVLDAARAQPLQRLV